jgi:hypothetical protein
MLSLPGNPTTLPRDAALARYISLVVIRVCSNPFDEHDLMPIVDGRHQPVVAAYGGRASLRGERPDSLSNSRPHSLNRRRTNDMRKSRIVKTERTVESLPRTGYRASALCGFVGQQLFL